MHPIGWIIAAITGAVMAALAVATWYWITTLTRK